MITLILQELLSLGMCSEIENRLKNKFENENCVTQRLRLFSNTQTPRQLRFQYKTGKWMKPKQYYFEIFIFEQRSYE